MMLKNYLKDIYKAYAIPASRHWAMTDHVSNRDPIFIIIDHWPNPKNNLNRDSKKELLTERENFFIKELTTLKPKGLS